MTVLIYYSVAIIHIVNIVYVHLSNSNNEDESIVATSVS